MSYSENLSILLPMYKSELESIISVIIPKLFGFAFAITGNEDSAEQLVVDSYTKFLVAEKKFIENLKFNAESREERVATKKYLFHELLKSILDFAVSSKELSISDKIKPEYENFYSQGLRERAMIYLKEVLNLSPVELQIIFTCKRHEVLELFHNANYMLTKDLNWKGVNL